MLAINTVDTRRILKGLASSGLKHIVQEIAAGYQLETQKANGLPMPMALASTAASLTAVTIGCMSVPQRMMSERHFKTLWTFSKKMGEIFTTFRSCCNILMLNL